jgi:putative ABC transport system permease protein
MEGFLQDLRLTFRTLRKSPGFTAVAVLTLALGIGANTAIFSVVDTLVLRPLPYTAAERLVVPRNLTPEGDRVAGSYADYLDWRRQTDVFERVALFQPGNVNLAGAQEAERVLSLIVSQDFFATLGVRPVLGRTFLPDEHTMERPDVVILSHGLWRRRFGGDPEIVGKAVVVNSVPSTVVGVMSRGATWPEDTEVWRPIPLAAIPTEDLTRRDNFIWQPVARLAPQASLETARARVAALAKSAAAEHPEFPASWSATVIPLGEWVAGPEMRTALLVLLGAVGLVLLIACGNVANLLLARSAARAREIAVRTALGAERLRLVRQLLTESLVLALLGGVFGCLLAAWGITTLVALAPPGTPRMDEVGLNLRVLVFGLAITLATSLIFGLAPALKAARSTLSTALREGAQRTTEGFRATRARGGLIVAEVALSLVLVVGAGLMIKSLVRLQQVDPGIRVERLLSAMITVPSAKYESEGERSAFYQELIRRLSELPDVEAIGLTSALPVGGGGLYLGRAFLSEGQPPPPAGPEHEGQWNVVSPGYFRTVGIPLVRGRDFTASDDSASTPVIILSESFARRIFLDGDALGRRIRSWRDENVLREVIGIVGDVRYSGLGEEPDPLVYVPHAQNAWSSMALVARSSADPSGAVAGIRRLVRELDPDLAVADVRTMPEVLDESLASPRFTTLLLSIFAAIALVLAAIGLYGIISYSVAQRTRELGIRLALGADAPHVRALVLRQGMTLTAAGLVIGLVGATAMSRVLSSLLYEVSTTDPPTFVAISALLATVALIATYVPARRATRVDPVVALRAE